MLINYIEASSYKWVEYSARYFCELVSPISGRQFSTFEEFDDDGDAINYFLAQHNRQVKRIYTRRARVIYNVLKRVYDKEWITVPVYTRID